MTELNDSTLSQLPPKVATPPYDRSQLKRGIAHFGVGNFHRAHQAFYIDRCLALPDQRIGALSVSALPAANGAGRRPISSGPRTVCIRSPSRRPRANPSVRVIGAQLDYLLAPEQPAEVLELLTDPDLRIVTLTITEGGYHVDPAVGRFRHRPPGRGPRPGRQRRAAHGVRLRHRGFGAATLGRDQAVHRGVV